MEKLGRKISLGVSACVYGAKVRYNVKGWPITDNLGREKSDFIWTPVCPEVMSGLGVPRNPISLQGGNGFDILQGKAHVRQKGHGDVTEFLKKGADSCLETLKRAQIDAYIFMEGSPSCGVFRTTLKNERLGSPPGLFGAMLMNEGIFLIPAQDLQSPIKWWDWRRRLVAHVWLKNQEINSKKDLYKVWHVLKFLCQELDESWSREFGHKIAKFDEEFSTEELSTMKGRILELLRKPSTTKKIKEWLWKNYKYLEKNKGMKIEEIHSPEDLRSITHIASELIKIEVEARKEEENFGSSPISYRPER